MQDGHHDANKFHQNIGGCLEATIGEHGLAPSAFASWLSRVEPHVAALKDDYRNNCLALLRIAEDTADIDAAEAALSRLSEGAQTLVFFGTGGSSLGGQTLAQIAGWKIPGVATEGQKSRPRTRFYDNLDGETLAGVLNTLDLSETRFIVTSKSGGTYSASITGVICSTFSSLTVPLEPCDSAAAVAIAGFARSVSARSIGTRMDLNIGALRYGPGPHVASCLPQVFLEPLGPLARSRGVPPRLGASVS